jgi:hypothetical protein
MTRLCVFGLALLMSGVAYPQDIMDTPNSDYGFTPPSFTTNKSCFTLDGDGNLANMVNCPGGDVMAENFRQTSDGPFQIFDFEINNLSNFTITLTGTSNFAGGGVTNSFGYGGFLCDTGAATAASSPDPGHNGIGIQCFGNLDIRNPANNMLMTNVDSFTNVPNINVASFHVRGSGNGYVFFGHVAVGNTVSAKITFDRTVHISIKPNATPPVAINAGSRGTIPVAILSTPTFNAVTSVDASSLTFGRSGNEQSLVSCNGRGEDVNGDGLPDLVCRFQTQSTGFQSGDTLGILTGKTVQGSPIVGQEAIVIVP